MPRETLRSLDADVSRLLAAGAMLAASDEGLRARHAALAGFAAKIPALARVAEQVAKVTSARGKSAAPELLNLAAMSAQLRATHAQPAKSAEDALKSVEQVAALPTPLPASALEPLFKALTSRGEGRTAAIADAAARGAVVDLRLLGPCLAALEDSAISATVADEVLPKFGAAAVPGLLAALALDGGAADAARLACIAKLRGSAARELLERALSTGSPALRAAALEALAAQHDPSTEALARQAIASDKSREVRAAALRALGASSSEVSLETLLTALRDEHREIHQAAQQALITHRHPSVTARVLALLTPETVDVKEWQPPRASRKQLTPAEQKAAQKAQQDALNAVANAQRYAVALFRVLDGRNDPSAEPRLLEVWRTAKLHRVRYAAGEALARSSNPAVLPALCEAFDWESTGWNCHVLAVEALVQDPARAFELAAPYFSRERLAKKNGGAAADAILGKLQVLEQAPDPRWFERCIGLLADDVPATVRDNAARVLGRLRDPRAVEPLLALVKPVAPVSGAIEALGKIGDKRAVPALVALLGTKAMEKHPYAMRHALAALDDPAAVAPLEAWLKRNSSKSGPLHEQLRALLERLRRDRTLS